MVVVCYHSQLIANINCKDIDVTMTDGWSSSSVLCFDISGAEHSGAAGGITTVLKLFHLQVKICG
jgi:hypothetical protein